MSDDILKRLARLEDALATIQEALDLLSTAPTTSQASHKPSYPTPASYEEMYGHPASWEDEPAKIKQAHPRVEEPWWKRLLFRRETP